MNAPALEDLFEFRDGVARRRAGVVAAGVAARALATVPTRYASYTREAWRGKWPFPGSLSTWPNPAPDGSPAAWVVVLIGSVGVGKTHAATALYRGGIARSQHGGAWLDVAELLDSIRLSFDSGCRFAPEVACYSPGVLLLDDLGAERGTDWARDRISSVLRYRHRESLPTLVTSNARSSAELAVALDPRIVSRFAEGEVVLLAGPDRRIS